jgi:FtsP/CotA-like multicopper oxidase with cupredoxin domain
MRTYTQNFRLFGLMFVALALANCDSGTNSSSTAQDDRIAAHGVATALSQPILPVLDTNPDPDVFEANLIVDEQDVMIDSTVVHSIIYKDANSLDHYAGTPAGIPVPQIDVKVGDEVIVTLTNNLAADCAAIACDTSIHWHGIELDNDSDGTGVTQNHLAPGETYTYRFHAPRPGVFWFHPHMKPGPQTFAGTYGSFIVHDLDEPAMQLAGTIPPDQNTHTMVLSDIEFDTDGDVGYLDGGGDAVPWAMLREQCGAAVNAACNEIRDAETVLVNGQSNAIVVPKIKAKSGSGIRLRLINVATNRYFQLSVSGNGTDNNLYRIGGEGGFLESARREGGILGTWDTKFSQGEIVLSAAQRADVVIVPTGNHGDIISINGLGYDRGNPGPSDTAGVLLEIEIDDNVVDSAYAIGDGSPILPGGVEDLKLVAISDFFTAPIATGNPGDGNGMTNQQIILDAQGIGVTSINGVQGHLEDSGPDYTQVAYGNATRYAKVGDTLEFIISNDTGQHHPFHLHGFSFQPVRVVDNGADPDLSNTADDTVLYDFAYNEFIDVIDLFPGQSIVLRTRLDDRGRITDNRQEAGAPAPNLRFGSGGAAGRWVFHCHIFLHAAVGMISELVVVNTDRDGDGVTTEFDCNDFDVNVTGCPPIADAGPDQVLECSAPTGTAVFLDGTSSSDPDMDMLTYMWSATGVTFDDVASATPTGLFPNGSTTVTLTVSDGETDDSDDVIITVEDTTPPEINVSLDPVMLWPPNHNMVMINATVDVSDSCDVSPNWWLSALTSDEADNGDGDGNTINDIQNADIGTADTEFDLRAERSGQGDGRTYTVEYTAEDADGNQTSDGSAEVMVAHDKAN